MQRLDEPKSRNTNVVVYCAARNIVLQKRVEDCEIARAIGEGAASKQAIVSPPKTKLIQSQMMFNDPLLDTDFKTS